MNQFKRKLFLVFFLYTSYGFATINIDQLLQETELNRTSNPQLFNENLILLESKKDGFTKTQKDHFDYLTYYQQGYNGQFKESLKNFEALYNRSHSIEIKFRSKAKIANIHVISGRALQSLNALDYVLNNVDNIERKSLKQLGYKIAQTVYFLIEEYDLSEDFSNLVLANNPSENDKCTATTNIGRVRLRKDIDVNKIPEKFINESLEVCESIGDFVFSNLLRMDWLKYRLNLKTANLSDYQYVLNHLKENESQIENTHYKNLINIKNSLFAITYWKLKDVESALSYAHLTMKGSQSIGSTLQKISALEILIEHYANTGNTGEAFKYLEEKNKADNIYYNQQQAKLMAYQTVKHDSLAKSHQIKSLNQRNDLLQIKNQLVEKSKKDQQLINILFGIIVSFFILFAYRMVRQQKKFKKLSELDHMTLIYNRKGIRDFMAYLLPYSDKKSETVGYAILDLDLFKKVNDVYGHVVGDWVIKKSIQVCKDLNNEKVTFSRLGGEEFSIIIRDSNLDEIKDFSEQCRIAISNIKTLQETGHEFQISASFGITTTEISGYDYTNLMVHADNALYYSKENGRNQVTVYSPNNKNDKNPGGSYIG